MFGIQVPKKDIVGVIEGLSGEEQDALMKYLYRGFCPSLLELLEL